MLQSEESNDASRRGTGFSGHVKTYFSSHIAKFGVFAALLVLAALCSAQETCPRYAPGSVVQDPPALYSQNGKLVVNFTYQTELDENGDARFCFKTPDGKESPTLFLNPGDDLVLNVKNLVSPNSPGLPPMKMAADGIVVSAANVCGAATMTAASVNVHYHGANVSPSCHSDEVIRTLINTGDTFQYQVTFPADEPPGLYYYHPHVHGISEGAARGGATGLIVIGGIQNVQPRVAGLPQRLLIVRDMKVPGEPPAPAPANNVSLNYVPIPFPAYTPAIINVRPQEKQFWRLGNTAANTILDIALLYDGKPQKLEIVGLDGVPTGSQDGSRLGKSFKVDHVRVPTAGRVEFIMTTPSQDVREAVLLTRMVNTGPAGDSDPARPLAILNVSDSAPLAAPLTKVPGFQGLTKKQRFEGLGQAKVNTTRRLYFSEDPDGNFFITVVGQKPRAFSPDNPPAIVTHQGAVEEWTIENRAKENHEFHIHQLHFLLEKVNGAPMPIGKKQFLDTVDIPYWSGKGAFPSVTLRIDFRGPDVGDFVYHCHILEHEDGGMMATVRVLPH